VLLDTHALLWWLASDPALSPAAHRVISNTANTIIVSAASAWEISIKVRNGKLPSAASLAADFEGWLEAAGFGQLAISVNHGTRAGQLPGPHTDPFDRMLIAQAQAENLDLISNEAAFDRYGVRRIW